MILARVKGVRGAPSSYINDILGDMTMVSIVEAMESLEEIWVNCKIVRITRNVSSIRAHKSEREGWQTSFSEWK